MKSVADSAVSFVLVMMAASSLFSMVILFQIDRIVHQVLYRFGLQFNYAWAMPYWTLINTVFAVGWFNIIVALALQLHMVKQRRKEARQLASQVENEETTKKGIEPIEKAEDQKELGPTPSETPKKETPQTSETEMQEREEGKQTVIEDTISQEQPRQVEDQKEQESNPAEESEAEQEETKPEPQEKSEETPIIAGVSKEEFPQTIEETQQV